MQADTQVLAPSKMIINDLSMIITREGTRVIYLWNQVLYRNLCMLYISISLFFYCWDHNYNIIKGHFLLYLLYNMQSAYQNHFNINKRMYKSMSWIPYYFFMNY